MAKKAEGAIAGITFGVEVPEAERTSRYEDVFLALVENPGQIADVTDAMVERGRDNASVNSFCITLRKRGFKAVSRQGRVYAAYDPDEALGSL